MDTVKIISELRAERDRINQAITALESLNGVARPARAAHPAPRRAAAAPKRHLSAAARQRISHLLKLRWAARKKQGKNKL